MSSSDSEDDCYGNVAQKLQAMKNKYQEDKFESTNLLNDSNELDEIVKKAGFGAKKKTKSTPARKKKAASAAVSDDTDTADQSIIENLLSNTSRRVTRSSTKRCNSEVVSTEPEVPPDSNRRASDVTATTTPLARRARGRGRGRGRIRGASQTNSRETQNTSAPSGRSRPGRGRRRQPSSGRNLISTLPIYSVGNTDEYPDMSDNQTLFSNKKDEVVVINENDTLDENEELSVKVYWQSSEIFKFTIRKYQKFTQVFDYFSKKEKVSHDKLLFTYNDKILKSDDTPDSIDYSIVKFIDGGIVNESVSQLVSNNKRNVRDGIIIKFQCQNVKKPYETSVLLDDKLSLAMMKCAEHLEKPLDKLKFEFDGDSISGTATARELELEGGECIDVKLIS